MKKQVFTALLMMFILVQSHAQDSLARYSLSQLDSIIQQLKAKEAFAALFPYTKAGIASAKQAEDTIYAKMLFHHAYAFDRARKIDSAIYYYQQALDIQFAKIPNHKDYVQSLNFLGIAYFYKGNYTKAEELLTTSLDLRKSLFGTQNADYAGNLNNLATAAA